jgi:hypothetical protein
VDKEKITLRTQLLKNREKIKSTGTPTGSRFHIGCERHPFFFFYIPVLGEMTKKYFLMAQAVFLPPKPFLSSIMREEDYATSKAFLSAPQTGQSHSSGT